MVAGFGRSRLFWSSYLCCGLLVAGLYFALPSPAAQNLLYDFVAVAAVAAILGGIWLHRPANVLPWLLLALGDGLAVGGDLIWTYNENVLGQASPFPSGGDLLYLAGYLAFFAGTLLLIRAQRARDSRAATIDTAIVTLGIGSILWTFLVAPVMADSARPLFDRLVASAYPAVDLLVLVAAVRLALGLKRRTVPLHLLLLALTVTFVTDIAYAVLVAQGRYSTGNLIDAGWLIGYTLHGTLALHPAMSARPDVAGVATDLTPRRLVLLASVALTGPGLLAYQALFVRAIDMPIIAGVSATLFLLSLARLQLLAIDRARANAAQRLLARAGEQLAAPLDRDSTLRTIAALAVPALADWCIIDLRLDDDTRERALVYHADPAQASATRTLAGRRFAPCLPAPNAPLARSIRDGGVGLDHLTLAAELADMPEHRDEYAALGVGAYMQAPIEARSRQIGTFAVVSADPARRYDEHELGLLTELSRRAGLALDNTALRDALAARERELQDLVGQLLQEQEDERRRVAYDVHDGLAQLTASVYQRLQAYEYRYQPRTNAEKRDLREALSVSQQAVAEARRVIANLRPIALDDFGLGVAVRRQAEYLRAEGWQITYRDCLGGERFAPTVETALYRVAQEALNNIRKHARTQCVWLDLERDATTLSLRVRDEGIGLIAMPPAAAGAGERIGLRGMRERVTLLGGEFRITSEPGRGTVVFAVIPIPADRPS